VDFIITGLYILYSDHDDLVHFDRVILNILFISIMWLWWSCSIWSCD